MMKLLHSNAFLLYPLCRCTWEIWLVMSIDPVWSDTMSMQFGTVSESVFISVSFGSNEAHSQAARSQKG